MELSEAKETLKNIKRCCFEDKQYQNYGFMEQYMDRSDVEAIDTVLKALDNSISKDEVRNLDVIDISGFECVALEDIQKLLGE